MKEDFKMLGRLAIVGVMILLAAGQAGAFRDNFNDCDLSDWSTIGSSNSWSTSSAGGVDGCYAYVNTGGGAGAKTNYLNHSVDNNMNYFEVAMYQNHASGYTAETSIYFAANDTALNGRIYFSTSNVTHMGVQGEGFSYAAFYIPEATWYKVKIKIVSSTQILVDITYPNNTLINNQLIAYTSPARTKIALKSYEPDGNGALVSRFDDVAALPTYSLSGHVIDNVGIPLEDVDVWVYSAQSGWLSAQTDASGYYTFASLVGSTYSMQAWKVGYGVGTSSVYLNQNSVVDFTLTPIGHINITGYTKDAKTGAVLTNVNVSLYQYDYYADGSGRWFNTTSNASGYYSLFEFQPNKQINVNATKASYIHEDFQVTPLTFAVYNMDLYLLPTTASGGPCDYAVCGLVVDYPWHQKISGASVNLWNGTDSYTNTTNSWGYYEFNNMTDGDYTINASKSGFVTSSNESVNVTNNNAYKKIVLNPIFTLSVRAQDAVTTAYLPTFTACVEGTCVDTTNGTAPFTLGYGYYYISVGADEHYGSGVNVLLDATKLVTVQLNPLTPTTSQQTVYSPSELHQVKFIVQTISGLRRQGVNTTVYSSNGTQLNSGTTGTDGAVVFRMNSTTYYRTTFVNATLGINREAYLYPIDSEYTIYVNDVVSSVPEKFSYNISGANNQIILKWVDSGILNSLNFTIYNGTKTQVHQLITSNSSGQSTYTASSDVYYVYFTANTTQGLVRYNTVFDYRLGTKTGKDVWGWGSFTVPAWLQNALAVVLLFILAGSFGALHGGVGSIITGVFTIIFWSKGWLTTTGAGIGFLGGLVVISVIYYLRTNQAVKNY